MQKLRAQIDDFLDRAKAADAVERNEPELDIPDEIARREKCLATIAVAKARLEQRQREAGRVKGLSDDNDRRPRKLDGKHKRGSRDARDFGTQED